MARWYNKLIGQACRLSCPPHILVPRHTLCAAWATQLHWIRDRFFAAVQFGVNPIWLGQKPQVAEHQALSIDEAYLSTASGREIAPCHIQYIESRSGSVFLVKRSWLDIVRCLCTR